MTALPLKTFQRVSRVGQLRRDGRLYGDWSCVMQGTERAYARMVAAMADRGIDCAGCPPMWAWYGAVSLADAALLFDPSHELSHGFATISFTAPRDLVLLSDYGDWCDALFENDDTWIDTAPRWGPHPAQATLPYLEADWVSDIAPLPTVGWEDLDFIVASRVTKAPADLESHFRWHGDAFTDGQIIDTITPRTATPAARAVNDVRTRGTGVGPRHA